MSIIYAPQHLCKISIQEELGNLHYGESILSFIFNLHSRENPPKVKKNINKLKKSTMNQIIPTFFFKSQDKNYRHHNHHNGLPRIFYLCITLRTYLIHKIWCRAMTKFFLGIEFLLRIRV